MPMKIAVFSSGEGTNLQALLDACASGRVPAKVVLVASSRSKARSLERAKKAGIPTAKVPRTRFMDDLERDAFLASECRKAGADMICLAGWMLKLEEPLLAVYAGKILNMHPALLPSFGGKGLYGMKVHEAVLEAGAKVSGCTVHLVDEHYDNGPIVLQSTVPVFPGDTPKTLAERVLVQEHRLYAEAVKLFAENRVQVEGRKVTILPPPKDGTRRIRRAVLSVSDKTGIVEFAKGLERLGVEIISTSGTAKALREAGVQVRPLESLTGFPEILGGRVKTLHPMIHGGILLRRGDPKQVEEAAKHGVEPIDLVAVNLYPFEKTAARAASPYDQAVIEDIDIGGVALIRASAKNFEDVAVVTSPKDYAEVLKELEDTQGNLSPESRKRLALVALCHTAAYDTAISEAWGSAAKTPKEDFPPRMTVKLDLVQLLRYGENPHQRAALYVRNETGGRSFDQLHGKELSYNNLMDAFGTWENVCEFHRPAAVIFKHVTPSGVGIGATLKEAFERAWAGDPMSAFGGILALNGRFPADVAKALSKRFLEAVVAPDYEPEALAILKKKPNLRILRMLSKPSSALLLRSLGDEVLVTDPDRPCFGPKLKTVTQRAPTPDEKEALRFAWKVCKYVRSNAIVLAGKGATAGIGAGQMSRVDSARLAGEKMAQYLKENPKPEPLVAASDAFFPFRDGLDVIVKLGITAVIQPGGSVRDDEVIKAADEHGLAMVFTGMRHFRH